MNPLLRPDAVAQIVGVSTRTILRWAAAGEIPHIRIGKVVRFRATDVETFIESHAGRSDGAEVLRLERVGEYVKAERKRPRAREAPP